MGRDACKDDMVVAGILRDSAVRGCAQWGNSCNERPNGCSINRVSDLDAAGAPQGQNSPQAVLINLSGRATGIKLSNQPESGFFRKSAACFKEGTLIADRYCAS